MYTENYKTLMKDQRHTDGKIYHDTGFEGQCCQNDQTAQDNLQIQYIPYQIAMAFFMELECFLKFNTFMETQKILNSQKILRNKNGAGGTLTLDYTSLCCCYSVTKSFPALCDPKDCSTPGSSVLHYLLEFAQTHVH